MYFWYDIASFFLKNDQNKKHRLKCLECGNVMFAFRNLIALALSVDKYLRSSSDIRSALKVFRKYDWLEIQSFRIMSMTTMQLSSAG